METNTQQQGTWYLRIVQGPLSGQQFVIEHSLVTVGRDPGNHIVIDLPGVSRQHARLTYQNGWFFVEDLGGANGVTVNGVRIGAPQALNLGDQVGLSSNVTFVLDWVSKSDETALMGYAAASTPPQGEGV